MTRQMLRGLRMVVLSAGLFAGGPIGLAQEGGDPGSPVAAPVSGTAERGEAEAARAGRPVPGTGESEGAPSESLPDEAGRQPRGAPNTAPDGSQPEQPEVGRAGQRHTDPSQPEAGSDGSRVFDMKGSNPGSENIDYQGTVTVAGAGPVVKVTWKIGERSQTGVGFINGALLAVSFQTGSGISGVCLFVRNPETGLVTGFRAVATPDGGAWGRETWTPSKTKSESSQSR